MKRINKCPECESKEVIPIMYGLPSPEAELEREKGKIILGGCLIFEENPNWHCKNCGHEWK